MSQAPGSRPFVEERIRTNSANVNWLDLARRPNYGDIWLGELGGSEGAGIDGRPLKIHDRLFLEAGFRSSFQLWQEYGDGVWGAVR